MQDGTGDGDPDQIRARLHVDQVDGQGTQMLNEGGSSVFRAAIIATFTEEQLAILEDAEMTRAEKRDALQASFTEEQLALMESQQQLRAEYQKQNGTATTEGTMSQVRKRAAQQSGGAASEDAAQLQKQLRQQSSGMGASEAAQVQQQTQSMGAEAAQVQEQVQQQTQNAGLEEAVQEQVREQAGEAMYSNGYRKGGGN